ncbi:trans-sulfuration enzyme family protein [Actinomadura oligospora]|uniref:trans-sulfuration enzyme family protein n=1 Tax=Actinomadura oligospora TaxID=111804 RepID=UPI0004B09414|nr:PLP-dependent aspartate aminotransferase family protein [Actinomadura oligospora]
MTSSHLQLDSVAVHAGREDLAELGVHAPPIDLSTTNPLSSIEAGGLSYEAMAGGGTPDPEGGSVYARLWNPTVARFESALARLEHAEAAVAFSSGMAAMTAAILATLKESGGRRHVLAVRPLYGGTDHLLASGLLGAEVTYCSASQVAAARRPDTALVVLETPANPTLDLVDIRAVVEAAEGTPVLVDNTFATPILQNPLDLGAAMVLHSATKYLGGHGDVIAGVIACGQEQAAALRRVRAVTGGLLHPLGAYLLHRGLATLPVRVRAQQANARRIAAWLQTHPSVARVYYPGFDGDPLGLLGRQMDGTGAMISIDLHGGYEQAERVTSATGLFTHAVSLGGVDSLIQHPAALTHRPVAPRARPAASLVRLSIGLEDAEDLITDLDRALATRHSISFSATAAPAQATPETRQESDRPLVEAAERLGRG